MITQQQIKTDINRRIYEYFTKLRFNEKEHKYTLDNRVLTSVSAIVKLFIPYVNWDLVAHTVAPYRGTTGRKLIKDWQYEKEISIVTGHGTHKFGELLGKQYRPPNTNQERAIVKFWKTLDQHRYIRIAREVRMYHKGLYFSGTCDFILYDMLLHKLIIGDYKTNKDIFKQYGSKKLLYPFDFMLDRPYEHYEIQLSLYDILISQLGIPVAERWILWLMNDETCKQKKLPPASYKVYKTSDHKSTLLGWLHQKNNYNG